MSDEIFTIEPIKRKKEIIPDILPDAAPGCFKNSLCNVTAKYLSIIVSHFQKMGKTISENIQRNIQEKRIWNREDVILQKKLQSFIKYISVSSDQKDFLHLLYRTIAQIK